MNPEDAINQKAIDLWGRHFAPTDDVLLPLIYPPLKANCLLCVGMNPSSSKQVARLVKKSKITATDYLDFFSWRKRDQFDVGLAQRIETEIKMSYPFFKPFRELSRKLSIEWEHVDLFFIRERQQGKLLEQVIDRRTKLPTDFGAAQLTLAEELIRQLSPRLILVANAAAAVIFAKRFGSVFSEGEGFHLTKIADTWVPTFFSGMLAGGRALDRWSLQRLYWHMQRALNALIQLHETSQILA